MKPAVDFEMIQNTFIANQNQYRSIVAKYIKERNMAYAVAVVMFLLALGAVVSTVMLAHQAKVQALVFDKDGQYIGVPNTRTTINQKAFIASQLADYINYLYSVPADTATKEHNVVKVVAMTDSNYFSSQVLPLLKQNLLKYRDTQVMVKVNSIVPLSDGEWSIDFSTYVADHQIGSYKTILHYKQDLNLDNTSKMINNPLGIYVNNVDTQEKMQ